MSDIVESGVWNCTITIDKYWGDDIEGQSPYETIVTDNMLMYGGTSALWEMAIGNGTATAGQTLTYFNNTQAAIGVGDSATAEAATQTNLQATTNKLRKGMNAGYPQHTDGTASSTNRTIVFQATFATGESNYTWNEVAVFNSATDGTGRMLNRKVSALGTKTSASSWQITVSVSID